MSTNNAPWSDLPPSRGQEPEQSDEAPPKADIPHATKINTYGLCSRLHHHHARVQSVKQALGGPPYGKIPLLGGADLWQEAGTWGGPLVFCFFLNDSTAPPPPPPGTFCTVGLTTNRVELPTAQYQTCTRTYVQCDPWHLFGD